MRISRWAGAAVVGVAAGALTLGGAAAAQEDIHAAEPWQAIDTGTADGETGWTPDAPQVPASLSTIADATTVVLQWADGDAASNLGTSVETLDLGVEVQDGTVVSFHYKLADGAVCGGGAPRMFVEIAGTIHNTGGDCGTDGTVELTVPAGTIGHAGLVYDNGTAGTVTISDVRIGDRLVRFDAAPDPDPPTETAEPTTEPTTAAPGKGGADEELAQTGVPTGAIVGGGLALAVAGGGMFLVARRRGVTFTA